MAGIADVTSEGAAAAAAGAAAAAEGCDGCELAKLVSSQAGMSVTYDCDPESLIARNDTGVNFSPGS